ncbi:hypothetical protein JHK82_012288 [Glycine max]|uniref:Leucine-rich repeat-containing N-terminal plant-type domain-containing protein n=2 Tax=Glycine subgen. Soja TaxID=1462606 RepID=A0A0R0JY27_SOYBN|nr:hypothetical protein JHK85_012639 [Glycine max]KAG5057301.1 hypothetical protein JHK86_012297 [Glycine max]KAG5154319.1 hypothetical protein JHK82_012288 [Glycine max]RZC11626.1 Somatic embryogenesis receptor kinase 1 [Glycine soja]
MQVHNPNVKVIVAPKASTIPVVPESRHSIVNREKAYVSVFLSLLCTALCYHIPFLFLFSLAPNRGELYSNNISGPIPNDLGNLTNLVSLDLYLNRFSGPIPESLGKLSKLCCLRLNDTSLTGLIPMPLSNITTLQMLDLSNNQLSGVVPDSGSFSLFTPISFNNNLDLCGPVTGHPCPGSPPFSPPPPFVPPSPISTPEGNSATSAIAGGVAAGVALLFAAPAIVFAWWRRRKPQEFFFDVPKDPEVHLGQLKRFSLR